jgi:hypothetical protein
MLAVEQAYQHRHAESGRGSESGINEAQGRYQEQDALPQAGLTLAFGV